MKPGKLRGASNMNETIYSLASLGAMFGWTGLGLAVFAPPGRLRDLLLTFGGRMVPIALCLLYAVLLVIYWGTAPDASFSSLSAVQTLFSVAGKMLGGWVHFLAFDLLIGYWITNEVLVHGRSRLPLTILLPATFMYGPIGLLLYVLTRLSFLSQPASPSSAP